MMVITADCRLLPLRPNVQAWTEERNFVANVHSLSRMAFSILLFLSRLLRLRHKRPIIAFLWAAALAPAPVNEVRAEAARYAIAMHGRPALPEDLEQLPYANRSAPKGGRLVQGILGTFDSLNPFIVKGIAPQVIRGYVVESLMARGFDEPFTLYGLLAQLVETNSARDSVVFHLNPAARFSDGRSVTPADVLFSWQLL